MMAVRFPEFVKRFRYPDVTGGQLPADVYQFGGGWWLTVCPLCGMAHDVTLAIRLQQATYEPVCSVRLSHPPVYRQWLIEHPEARAALRAAYEAARGELGDMSMSAQIDAGWAIQSAKAHGIHIGSESVDIDAIMRGELL